MNQFVYNWYFTCCHCSKTCSHVSSIQYNKSLPMKLDNFTNHSSHDTLLPSWITVLITHCSYFLSKVNIWNVYCVQAMHQFSTHERTFLWKCQTFRHRKCLDRRWTRTPNLWIHAECSIRAKHLLSHVFEYWLCNVIRLENSSVCSI